MADLLWTPEQFATWVGNETGADIIGIALQNVYTAPTIQERFDALGALLDGINTLPPEALNLEYYVQLQNQATVFALQLVDAHSPAELAQKFADRKRYKEIDPEYMPWHTPAARLDATQFASRREYTQALLKHVAGNVADKVARGADSEAENAKVTGKIYSSMRAGGKAEDVEHNVVYLIDTAARENYRLFTAGGRFKEITLNANGNLQIDNFDTKKFGPVNEAIFVVGPKGDMYAGPSLESTFHHSTVFAGGETLFPGIISVTNGNLQRLANESGHYRPPPEQTVRILSYLRTTGVLDTKNPSIVWDENIMDIKEITNIPKVRLKGAFMDETKQLRDNVLFGNKQETPLAPLLQAAAQGNIAEFVKLQQAGASIQQQDHEGRSPLHLAILNRDSELFAKLLPQASSLINSPDKDGMTPLLLAIAVNSNAMVSALLTHAADPNQANNSGLTPLSLAAWKSNSVLFQELMTHGADPSQDSQRLADFALRQARSEVIATVANPAYKIDLSAAIQKTIDSGGWEGLIQLLVKLPADTKNISAEILAALQDEAPNMVSEFINYLENIDQDKQKTVSAVLDKTNALGMLFGQAEVMERCIDRLNSNGFDALVTGHQLAAQAPVKALSSTALLQMHLQTTTPLAGKEFSPAQDYQLPMAPAAPLNLRKLAQENKLLSENNPAPSVRFKA